MHIGTDRFKKFFHDTVVWCKRGSSKIYLLQPIYIIAPINTLLASQTCKPNVT